MRKPGRSRSILALVAALATFASTAGCIPCELGWHELPVTGESSVDLTAVVALDGGFDPDFERAFLYLAAGEGGAVAVVTRDRSSDELVLEQVQVGVADLHAATSLAGQWWVVGDGGMAAVSADFGRTWTQVDLAGTSANLRALVGLDSGLVVVGDEVVLVQTVDGTWTEIPPPQTGWGQLRALHHDSARLHAVGLGGVAWSTEDPGGVWEAVDVGTNADLLAIGPLPGDEAGLVVVGVAGTLSTYRASEGWVSRDVGTSADLIAYANAFVLGADGAVFEIDADGTATNIGSFVGGRSLARYHDDYQLMIVGQDGLATALGYARGCTIP